LPSSDNEHLALSTAGVGTDAMAVDFICIAQSVAFKGERARCSPGPRSLWRRPKLYTACAQSPFSRTSRLSRT